MCSRPTAVNLSDAATKLKEIIAKAASTCSEADTVFQVESHFSFTSYILNSLRFYRLNLLIRLFTLSL